MQVAHHQYKLSHSSPHASFFISPHGLTLGTKLYISCETYQNKGWPDFSRLLPQSHYLGFLFMNLLSFPSYSLTSHSAYKHLCNHLMAILSYWHGLDCTTSIHLSHSSPHLVLLSNTKCAVYTISLHGCTYTHTTHTSYHIPTL